MQYLERFRRNPEAFKIESRGNAHELVRAIQENIPQYSGAISHLAMLLKERQDRLIYQELPTVGSLFEFVKDKRALLDNTGKFSISSEDEIPEYLQRYLKGINSGRLMTTDVKATVDKAFFVLIHPVKRGSRWASIGHHNFTTYRGDMYGPGWAEPKYGLFGDNPRGFDIGFEIATGYDSPETIDRYCPEGGNSSRIAEMTFGPIQLSFSIGNQQGKYRTAYVPIKVSQWNGYDIKDGVWQKGWQVFGISGGVLLNELEVPR